MFELKGEVATRGYYYWWSEVSLERYLAPVGMEEAA